MAKPEDKERERTKYSKYSEYILNNNGNPDSLSGYGGYPPQYSSHNSIPNNEVDDNYQSTRNNPYEA